MIPIANIPGYWWRGFVIIISEYIHLDPATGEASAAQQDTLTVNAFGQVLTSTDRNGTAHAVSYDVLGRVTDDAVTLLGVNVDGAVRCVHTDYDGLGNAYFFQTCDRPT